MSSQRIFFGLGVVAVQALGCVAEPVQLTDPATHEAVSCLSCDAACKERLRCASASRCGKNEVTVYLSADAAEPDGCRYDSYNEFRVDMWCCPSAPLECPASLLPRTEADSNIKSESCGAS
jgi:hypothetical protein